MGPGHFLSIFVSILTWNNIIYVNLQIRGNGRRGLCSSKGAVELKETTSNDMRWTGIYNSLVRDLVAALPGTCNSIGVERLGRMIVSPLKEDRTDWVEAGWLALSVKERGLSIQEGAR